MVWIQFIACTAVIVFAGTKLSQYGDIIAEKTGLGRTWIGVLLMASVTSLPELITGISSVAIFDLPNIAAGDVFGSCMFNLLIIAVLDAMSGASPISSKAHQGQVITAGFGVVLLGLAGVSIVAGEKIPAVGWIGAYSLLFLAAYLVAMRVVFLYEKKRIGEMLEDMAEAVRHDHISRTRAFAMYGCNALLVIGAATWLPHLGEEIAELTGLGRTFVGSIFIALSTSLPELVVSIAALRIGAVDMVLGNLFGSNLFNIGILALDDMLYVKGPLLSYVSTNHLVTAFAAMAMTGVAVIGLTYRASKKRLLWAWDSLGIVLVYALATYLLFAMRQTAS
ncbi:MAG TPA: sodium:calcium antiporter [Burkholderiales bacterium]|nr:sodium:calcium antiporter [Burkholderiales bacterium]